MDGWRRREDFLAEQVSRIARFDFHVQLIVVTFSLVWLVSHPTPIPLSISHAIPPKDISSHMMRISLLRSWCKDCAT